MKKIVITESINRDGMINELIESKNNILTQSDIDKLDEIYGEPLMQRKQILKQYGLTATITVGFHGYRFDNQAKIIKQKGKKWFFDTYTLYIKKTDTIRFAKKHSDIVYDVADQDNIDLYNSGKYNELSYNLNQFYVDISDSNGRIGEISSDGKDGLYIKFEIIKASDIKRSINKTIRTSVERYNLDGIFEIYLNGYEQWQDIPGYRLASGITRDDLVFRQINVLMSDGSYEKHDVPTDFTISGKSLNLLYDLMPLNGSMSPYVGPKNLEHVSSGSYFPGVREITIACSGVSKRQYNEYRGILLDYDINTLPDRRSFPPHIQHPEMKYYMSFENGGITFVSKMAEFDEDLFKLTIDGSMAQSESATLSEQSTRSANESVILGKIKKLKAMILNS